MFWLFSFIHSDEASILLKKYTRQQKLFWTCFAAQQVPFVLSGITMDITAPAGSTRSTLPGLTASRISVFVAGQHEKTLAVLECE